ncbi:Hypothetical_protein [Hexamita inflata]|uniref:Hypothetical_protein n=1 Tax=Hexamita inflata TaxID=28002 RepID=A0AA86QHD2_9EUKA|nr:Hypothetical protein HINF_LOCUS47059 [Hexamita inflata]
MTKAMQNMRRQSKSNFLSIMSNSTKQLTIITKHATAGLGQPSKQATPVLIPALRLLTTNLTNLKVMRQTYNKLRAIATTVVSEPTLILTNVYVIIALENQITVFMLIITYSINSAVHFFFTSSFK